jgi:hypothetical protein
MMKIDEILQKDQELWDLFSRKEEYHNFTRDTYDRFPYSASSNRNICEPLVSKYLIEHGFTADYPDNKSFAVCLTHDIDGVYASFSDKTEYAFKNLRQGSLSGFMHYLGRFPLCNFSDIMSLEEKYEATSSFYFMAEDAGEQDYAYRIDDFEPVLKEIVDRGCEVGLHGGHTSYLNVEELKIKKKRLEKILDRNVIGYRNHYLRFRVPETWEYLHDAGFSYDTTFGYHDHIGFRNGMCHPFRPFNRTTGKPIEILEIPLTVMMNTFDDYMKIDMRRAWEMTKNLIDIVQQYHGVLTVLWHNTDLIGHKRKFYEKLLNYCAEKNAWMTSGQEIATWWNQNGFI